MILPSDENAKVPLKPSGEPLDDPTPFVPEEAAPVLRLRACPVPPVRRDHPDASLLDLRGVGRLRTPWHRPGSSGDRRVGADGQRKTASVHDGHDLHTFPPFRQHVRNHPVYALVVWIALRPGLQYPQHGFKDPPGRYRSTPPLPLRPVLLREAMADPLTTVHPRASVYSKYKSCRLRSQGQWEGVEIGSGDSKTT